MRIWVPKIWFCAMAKLAKQGELMVIGPVTVKYPLVSGELLWVRFAVVANCVEVGLPAMSATVSVPV